MKRLRWLSTALAALTLYGCAFTPTVHRTDTETFHSPVWTTEGLYLVDMWGPGVLFITHPATGLELYTGVMIDDIEIRSKEGAPELLPAELEWLRGYCRRTLLRAFRTNDLELADAPGPVVLRVRMAINDVDFKRRYLDGGGSFTLNPSGGITAVLELRDSVDRTRVMLFSEKRPLPKGVYLGPGWIERERIEDAVHEFTLDVRMHIEAAHLGDLPVPAGPRPSS